METETNARAIPFFYSFVAHLMARAQVCPWGHAVSQACRLSQEASDPSVDLKHLSHNQSMLRLNAWVYRQRDDTTVVLRIRNEEPIHFEFSLDTLNRFLSRYAL
jgi:hypothetical protein